MWGLQNNWVPRRRDEGPKTIQHLHQEVKQADQRQQLQLKKAIPGKFNQDSNFEHKTPPKGGSSKPLSELMAKEEAPAQDCGEEDNTLNERQRSSEGFVRALIRAVCQSVIVDCGVRTYELLQRVSLLKRFIKDDQKQLVVHIDQPDGEGPSIHLDALLRMFFDVLLDEVIQDETFFKWRSSAASVLSLHNFFTLLHEANRRFN
ncbi:hypothetical protein D4764_02G0006200 [Takifugu flavidus]|uniref:Uncharacterized protein n=1 Tax=Takifugu flavidus TaxID=433684 RepID=A0A5C6NLN7_9TELE|nr:hypothetical protein D4764_02G0006200 [Takifugu flavidus]